MAALQVCLVYLVGSRVSPLALTLPEVSLLTSPRTAPVGQAYFGLG